ncbi:hypothetical protein [Pseudomonas sp. Q12-87]|uniref:hypothetical protein n=1 Tax=Pseudomonas sp. Q12-87 TaxID=177989 RepID=UPI00031C4022|nr:hypothetical protein [Pseudomonas sp. Q12-87]
MQPTYATKEMCLETTRVMAPRKGVKLKCRSERLWVPTEASHPVGYDRVVSTDAKTKP